MNDDMGARRLTRHAASHVDFQEDCDIERIPDDEITRRKRRFKPQHCPPCQQSIHDNTSSKANDTLRFKNREKLEAALTQHLDYSTKITNSATKNSHERKSRPSSRKQNVHQRSQNNYHQPDAYVRRCQDHNNLENYEDIEVFECPRLDSRMHHIAHSDDATEENDYRISCGQNARNFCKDFNFRWNSPPGEPHLKPRTDSSPDQRRKDFQKSEQWHFGQGENILDDYRVGDSKPWMESSTRATDNWQYERDKKELKDLCEGVQRFAKRKVAGCRKQKREEAERDEGSQQTFEKINRFLGKLPKSRQSNTDHVSKNASSEKHHKSPMEESRKRPSKIDACKSHHSSSMGANNGVDSREHGTNSDEELCDIQLELSRQMDGNHDEEERKEGEEASETEEEARQLAKNESETERLARKIKDIWSELKLGNNKISGTRKEKKVEIDFEKSIPRTREIDTSEGCNEKKEIEPKLCKAEKAAKQNYYVESDSSSGDNEDEFAEENKVINSWERIRGNKETEHKTCGDLRNKTKSSLDEIIDNGLSYEMKRGNSVTPWEIKKKVPCDLEVSEQLPSKRETSDATRKLKRDDWASYNCTREDTRRMPVEIIPGECFTKSRNSRDYEKKRKNRRLMYLNNMQSNLSKLFDLEKCSPERHSSLPIVTTDLDSGIKVTKSPEKIYATNDRVVLQSNHDFREILRE